MTNKSVKIIVDSDLANQRIDLAISKKESVASRSRAQEIIELGLVYLNKNLVTKSSIKVSEGDIIEYQVPSLSPSSLEAVNIPLNIFYEDEHLIVINKPSGMVVHPSAGHQTNTLVNALLYHCKRLSVGFKEERPGIVHRIDKDTSGLIVVAKDDETQQGLAQQFVEKSVHRRYWAICFGILKNQQGRIESLIGRAQNERKKFSSRVTSGKSAVTNYEVLATYKKDLSLVSLKLETGRTHQIRVHLNDMGHPIVADWFYCNRSRLKSIGSNLLRKEIEKLSRFALHAAELGFKHPISGKQLLFKTPPPESLNDILTFCDFFRYLK